MTVFVSRYGMDLPERLRRMREDAGLTQAELADRLNVIQTWVSKRERGVHRVTPDDVAEWAEACGYRGATVFVTNEVPEDLVALLETASPEELNAVMRLLRAFPHMSSETRDTVVAMLEIVWERARATPA